MTQQDIIQAILKDTDYRLNLFTEDEINKLRDRICIKSYRGKETPFVKCVIRGEGYSVKT